MGTNLLRAIFSDTEINTRICKVFPHGAILNLGIGPTSLRERVDSPWVSLLGLNFAYMCQFQFIKVFVLLCRVSGVFTVPHRGHLT
jgi:hypothetical protein